MNLPDCNTFLQDGDSLQCSSGYMSPVQIYDCFDAKIRSLQSSCFTSSFWLIVDFSSWKTCDCGGCIESMMPLQSSDLVGQPNSAIHKVTHPDDLNAVLAFTLEWIKMISTPLDNSANQYRVSINFRLLNPVLHYYWVMVQYAQILRDVNGRLRYGLIFVTDISHLKSNGCPTMNVFDAVLQQCRQYGCPVSLAGIDQPLTKNFTTREIEVLVLLEKGWSSKQIADQLKVSISTIDNHRQNMLHKNNCKTSSELVSIGIRSGVI